MSNTSALEDLQSWFDRLAADTANRREVHLQAFDRGMQVPGEDVRRLVRDVILAKKVKSILDKLKEEGC